MRYCSAENKRIKKRKKKKEKVKKTYTASNHKKKFRTFKCFL